MHLQDARNLFDYNLWANHRVVDACRPLPPEQFTRDLGSSFPSVRDTLVHILSAEWIWLERWNGRSPTSFPPMADFPTLDAVVGRWSEIEHNMQTYLNSLQESDLEKTIAHKNMAGQPFALPLWQMLQHVVNHSSYHRGQITTMLRQLGAKPVSTDLIAFYRQRATPASA